MWKTTYREIRQSFGRYAAILAIVALGVGFFVGLMVVTPAMVRNGGRYLNNHDLYDLRLLSTLGFDTIFSDALNQPVSLASMSTGTKRIFWLLANIFIASCNHVSCIGIEELETSIHPKMLKDLLSIISETLENTCLVISSHSPYLVQYLKPRQLYVGSMQELGIAQFRRIASTKEKKLLNAARSYGLSVGEYLFELMSGESSSFQTLQNYLEGF